MRQRRVGDEEGQEKNRQRNDEKSRGGQHRFVQKGPRFEAAEMLRHFPGELNLIGDGTIVLDGTPTLRARRDAIGAEVNRGNVVATAMVGVTQHRRKATTSEARGSPRPVQRAQKRVRVGCVFGTTNPTRQVRERRRSIFRERQTDFDRSLGRDAIPSARRDPIIYPII